MKKVLVMVALVMASVIVYAFNDSRETNQGKKEVTGNGEVVVMDKEMFLKDVFDYEKSKEWNYKGNKPPSSTYMQIGADHVAKQLLS